MMNEISSIIVVLYGTVLLLMGVFHVLSAMIRYFGGENKYPGYKKNLAWYLFAVLAYFLIPFIMWNVLHLERNVNRYENAMLVYLFVLPWGLAVSYWMIIYKKNS